MKKFLTAFLVLAFVLSGALLIFAGCGGGSDYEHTIVYYHTQSQTLQAVTQKAIDAFEAKYPGWKVEQTQVGGYDEVKSKIVADLQGNNQPDLAYCYADHVAQYIAKSKVVDLSKYLTSDEAFSYTYTDAEGNEKTQTVERLGFTDEQKADIVQTYLNEGYATNYADYDQYGYTDKSLLTLPFVKSTELLYYNKDALDALRLKPATTWDELWAQCTTLQKAYPTATPLGYDSEANWFITMCEQNGWGYTSAQGNHYLFNNDGVKNWLTDLKAKYEANYLTTQAIYGSYTSALFTKGTEGGIIYCIGSSGGASHQESSTFKAAVAPIPGTKKADNTVDSSVISQGPSLVMFTGGHDVSNATEKEKMTFLFIKELYEPAFQAEFSKASGYNPCVNKTFEVESYIDFMKGGSLTSQAAALASTLSDDFFTSPAFIGSSTARTQVGNVLQYAITGKKTVETALTQAIANCGGN